MYYTYSKKISGYFFILLFAVLTFLPITSSLQAMVVPRTAPVADRIFIRNGGQPYYQNYQNQGSYYQNQGYRNYYYNNPGYRNYYYNDRPYYYDNYNYTPYNYDSYYNPFYFWGNGLGFSIRL